MMQVDIGLRRVAAPVRGACAWLLGGSESARWLEQIAGWHLPDALQDELTLYVLPHGGGVLAALPPETPLTVKLSGAAFGCVAARVFLPVDAVLDPQLSDRDLEPLLRHDVSVVLPTLGWVGFSNEQTLRLSDLLDLPAVSPGRWREPAVGPAWNQQVASVSLAAPVSLEAFFEEEQKDIHSLTIDELPPASDEPRQGLLHDLRRKTIEPIARGARALSRRVSEGAGAPSWVNRLEDWASDQLRHVSRELEHLRNKELHRLLDLLDSDAEKGLRHALPLGGGTHRGLAPASAHLTARRVDFELGALGGGQPLDPWDVPYEIQQRLLTKYRQLASREKRLGRYRRAAFIYAELIGDLDTAAAVLEQGRHFREAAEIYRRHLHKPLLAARAYKAGGHYREALEIYEELEMWEDVGDASVEMEQTVRARAAFERARDQLLATSDRLGASRIAEAKLDDVEGALAIVEGGWPDSRQASDCLKRQVAIQGREGLHARTEELLSRLDTETPPHLTMSLVSCLSTAATSYPNARVRHRAADLSRRRISARLERASRDEAARLLENLYALAPEDRLLKRDTRRYLDTKQRPPGTARRLRESRPVPELVRSFELSSAVRWLEVKSMGSSFFALGHRAGELQLYRGNWSGKFEWLSWTPEVSAEGPTGPGGMPVTMELDATGHRSVILRHASGQTLLPKVFTPSRDVLEAETVAGDPGWLPRGALAVSNLSQMWVVLRHHGDRCIVSTYDDDGAHVADLADWQTPEEELYLTLACQNQFVVVGQTRSRDSGELLVLSLERRARHEESPTPLTPRRYSMGSGITGLRVAQPYTRSRVAVTMLDGVALHWLDSEQTHTVASDLESPSACMLRNGAMVVVSGSRVRVYRTDVEQPSLTSEMELPAQFDPAVDVVPGYAPNQFAILTAGGSMLVYALPSG